MCFHLNAFCKFQFPENFPLHDSLSKSTYTRFSAFELRCHECTSRMSLSSDQRASKRHSWTSAENQVSSKNCFYFAEPRHGRASGMDTDREWESSCVCGKNWPLLPDSGLWTHGAEPNVMKHTAKSSNGPQPGTSPPETIRPVVRAVNDAWRRRWPLCIADMKLAMDPGETVLWLSIWFSISVYCRRFGMWSKWVVNT